MTDPYAGWPEDPLSPTTRAVAVVPSDSDDLATVAKRLWIGGAGDVTLVTSGGDTVTYSAVPAGTYLQVRTKRVNSTGTDASSIVAEF